MTELGSAILSEGQDWRRQWDEEVKLSRMRAYERRKALAEAFVEEHKDDTSEEPAIYKIGDRFYVLGGDKSAKKVNAWFLEYFGYAHKSSASRRLKDTLVRQDKTYCGMCIMTYQEMKEECHCKVRSINCESRRKFPRRYDTIDDSAYPHFGTMNGLVSIGSGMGVRTTHYRIMPEGQDDIPVNAIDIRKAKGVDADKCAIRIIE